MTEIPAVSAPLVADLEQLNTQAEAKLNANPREAMELAHEALTLARAAGVRETQARSLHIEGTARILTDDTDGGESLLVEAERVAEELGQEGLRYRCINAIAAVAHQRGHYGRAFANYHRYLAYARRAGDRAAEGRALGNIGFLYFEMGEVERCLQLSEEVLKIGEGANHVAVCLVSANNLAECHIALGAYDAALALVRTWRLVAQREGMDVFDCLLQASEGAALLRLGEIDRGVAELEAAIGRARGRGDILDMCGAMVVLGEAYALQRRDDEALAMLREAHERCERAESLALQLKASRALLDVYESQGRHADALAHARTVLRLQEHVHSERLSRRTEVLAVEFEIDQIRKQAEAERQKTEALLESNDLLRRLQADLQHQATHDSLTGILNRGHFLQVLDETLAQALETDRVFGLAFLDLDGFKEINDSFGHHAGDTLLVEVAQRLSRATRSQDAVARLGGDEFAILIKDVQRAEEVEQRARRVQRALSVPVMLNDAPLRCSVSIGVATFPLDGMTASELLHQADANMYRRKRAKRRARDAGRDVGRESIIDPN